MGMFEKKEKIMKNGDVKRSTEDLANNTGLNICPNCGAKIDKDVTKCPYCGYINIEGAEKQYFEELGEIKQNLAEVADVPTEELKKGLSKSAKVVITTLVVLAVLGAIYAVILMIELQNHPKEFLTAEEEAYASAYREVAGEQLEEAYEARDIAALAQIFDKAYSEDRVSLWGDPHYNSGYAASCYMKFQQCLPNLDKDKITKKEAEEITYYCFYFYYRAYDSEDAEIFDPIRDDEIMTIITGRLGYSIQDMESFRDEVATPYGVDRSKVYKITKKNYKQYH